MPASEPALAGGLLMLAHACLVRLLVWKGDKLGVWYDPAEPAQAPGTAAA